MSHSSPDFPTVASHLGDLKVAFKAQMLGTLLQSLVYKPGLGQTSMCFNLLILNFYGASATGKLWGHQPLLIIIST